MFRQGDVLIIPAAAIPAGAQRQRIEGRIVLAEGEATGHAHALYEPEKVSLWAAANDERYLEVVRPTALRHEEHAPIDLAPGLYRVVRQYEYTPEDIRRVAD